MYDDVGEEDSTKEAPSEQASKQRKAGAGRQSLSGRLVVAGQDKSEEALEIGRTRLAASAFSQVQRDKTRELLAAVGQINASQPPSVSGVWL